MRMRMRRISKEGERGEEGGGKGGGEDEEEEKEEEGGVGEVEGER